MRIRRIGFFLLLAAFIASTSAQPLAFPGAAGFGKNAEGARGGSDPDVYIVTSLSDDGSSGTLRHAVDSVSGDDGRFIVFAVGGVITLNQGQSLDIDSPYITIAGQTAPNGGICIVGEGIYVNSHDVIVRGLRVRPSDLHYTQTSPSRSRDGAKVGEGTLATPTITDIIIDHCSFSWATDEIASAYRASANVTFQYNIFAEPLHDSVHWDESTTQSFVNGPHSMGPTLGPHAENITLYRNVTAHANNRNPSIKETYQAEIVNNIFYNFGLHGIQMFDDSHTGHDQSLRVNAISNMWLSGPDSLQDQPERIFHFKQAKASNGTEIYLSNNVSHVGTHHLAHDEDPTTEGFSTVQGSNLTEALKTSPVFSGISSGDIVTLTSAEDELDFLLDEVGARWPMRDAIDARVISHIENGTGAIVDVVYITPGSTPGQWSNPVGTSEAADVDSSGDYKLPDYATLGSGAPTDADSDGIPDSLEATYGSDPLADDDSDGYLNIEEYINSIIDSSADTTSPSVTITNPADEASVSGTISVTATASDNVGVVGVQFKLDGSNLGAEDTTAPYSVSWDTSAESAGSYTLTAVARDAASNTTTSSDVDVTVGGGGSSESLTAAHDTFVRQGEPTTNFNSTGTIYVKNSDPGAGNGSFYRAGYLRFDASSLTGTASSGTLTLTIVDNGQGSGSTIDHSLHLVGTDAWNETALTWNNRPTVGSLIDTESITATIGQSITFTLNQAALDQIKNDGYLSVAVLSEDDDVTIEYGDKNDGADAPSLDLVMAGDTTDPTVSITSPSDEAEVSGTISVTASASDNVGVVGVQFKLDGVNLGSEDTTAPYSVSWDTSAVSTGSYTLTAVARDAAANTTTSADIDVTVVSETTEETLDVTHDSFVRQGAPTTNFNSTGTIYVKNSDPGAGNGSFYRAGYLRFDASSLTGTVNSGTLTLTIVDNGQGSGTTVDHSLHLVGTDSWNETTLTWNNRPTVGALIDTQSITATIGQSITFTLNQSAIDQMNNNDYLSVAVVSEDDDVSIEYGDKNDGGDAPSLDLVVASGSGTAPTVSITNPGNNASVSGLVTVNASASDDVGVVGVQFKLDGTNLGAEDTTAPYSMSWDSSAVSTGSHALTAVARDGDSNTTTSATVTVTVATPSAAVVDTFESGNAADWTPDGGGIWSVTTDGTQVYRQTLDTAAANRSVLDDTDWTDQLVEADVKPISHDGSNRFYGVIARYVDSTNYYYLVLRTNNTVELKKLVNGSATTLDSASFTSSTGNWYTLRLEIVGTSLEGYVNGQSLVSATDTEFDEGSAALLTFFTSASFDDVIATPNVSGLTPFGDDFEDNDSDGWNDSSGTWSVVTDGTKVYSQSSTSGDGRSAITSANWSDQIVEADVKAPSFGSGGTIGLMGRYQDTGNYYGVALNGDSDTVSLVKYVAGTASTLATTSFTVDSATWYDVRLKILDTTLKVYVDGELELATTDSALADGSAGLVSSAASLRGDEVLISVP